MDPLSGATVIIAPGRRSMPRGKAPPPTLPEPQGRCPFCPDHEADTEIVTHEDQDADGRWAVRVVRNRFPLVRPDLDAARGEHEVIVESREHELDLADMSASHLTRVLAAYRHRLRALHSADSARSVILFRNRGRRAGSSQPHPHAQVVSLPFVPPELQLRADRAAQHQREHGRTALHAAVEDERRAQVRIVWDRGDWIALCPYASARAFETRLAPTFDCGRFADVNDDHLESLAQMIGPVLVALRDVSGSAEYNIVVREPPARQDEGAYFVIDVATRLGGQAGFELGSGTSVCVVAPEQSAQAMRDALQAF